MVGLEYNVEKIKTLSSAKNSKTDRYQKILDDNRNNGTPKT